MKITWSVSISNMTKIGNKTVLELISFAFILIFSHRETSGSSSSCTEAKTDLISSSSVAIKY